MSQIIEIDTEKLNSAISKQKEINQKILELFQNIQTNTNNLKDSWSTRTSEAVFKDFDKAYDIFESINVCNNNYTKFLEDVVIKNYTATDINIGNVVDTKIAVK